MKLPSTEDIIKQAQAMLDQVHALDQLPTNLPGRFVFSPPMHNRLVVATMAELHEARTILRSKYEWQDELTNKFYSCGDVMVVFAPINPERLPLPFELWVEGRPENFPKELLGDCELVPHTTTEYAIVCPR